VLRVHGSRDTWSTVVTRSVVVVTGLTSAHHTIRKVLKNEYSVVTIKNAN
jgi:hypothetical protein